jgi:DNA-binding NarL/FixJ family response regulator
MDIRMPQLDGIAATRLLSAQPHPPAVLVLTTFDADELVLRALQAGAAGFLLKDSPPADIVRAIDSVHAGDGTLSPRITRRLINLVAGDPDAATRREQARQRLAALTPREREVAAAVADGPPMPDRPGCMSPATVAHVSRLLVKLDAANRVQIALLVQNAAASRPRRPAESISHAEMADLCAIRIQRTDAAMSKESAALNVRAARPAGAPLRDRNRLGIGGPSSGEVPLG